MSVLATVVGAHDENGHVPDDRVPLVGRLDEIERLATLVGLTAAEPESAVLLSGDAGVGKTRLLAELRTRAEAAGYRVLVGHCLDFGDSALPYLPFSEAFGRLAADSPTLARSLVEAGPAIARLMPARRVIPEQPEPTDDTSHLDRPDLFASAHAALELLGRADPLLLIIEDVHWADRSTRELLSFLFSRRFDSPVAVVASYRSDDLHRRHPLRNAAAEWARLPGVTRLDLAKLPDSDVRALVGSLHPEPLTERAVRGIIDRAEGNAFFTEELVQAASHSPGALPEALADLLLVRLDQLDDESRLVVRAAAVSGRRVPHLLLERVVDGQVTSLDTALRTAVERNILLPMGRDGYTFRHALLAEAVYDDLLPGERVRLHMAYAKALQQGGVGGTAAELAKHARAANDTETAVRASIAAGDEAMAVAGPDEASRHYELALELATDSGMDDIDVVELTARACEAALAAGQTYRALALARDQLRTTSPDTSPQARLRLLHVKGSVAIVADAEGDALKVTTEAMELLEKHPDEPMRAQMLALHARALSEQRQHDEATRFATQALELADRLGLAGVAADARTTLARLRERPGETAASQAMLQETVLQARNAGDLAGELRSMFNLGTLQYEAGRIDVAREEYARTQERAEETGRPWSPYGLESRVLGIQAAYVLGDWDGASALADLRHQSPPDLVEAMIVASGLLVRAGRGDAAARELLPGLVPHGRREGMVSLFAGFAAIDLQGDRGDLEASTEAHDDTVATVGGMWGNKDFQARIRLSGLLLGQLASAVSDIGSHDREDLVVRAADLVEAAHRATALREQSVWDEGPEGRAWLARVEAEHARFRWLAGDDPPDPRRPRRCVGAGGGRVRVVRSRLRAGPVAGPAGVGADRCRPYRRGRGADQRRVHDRPVAARRAAAARAAHPRRAGGAAGADPARRATDRPRAGGAGSGRPGPQQPRDRRAPVHQREDGQRARVEHAGQARRLGTHRGRGGRPPARLPG